MPQIPLEARTLICVVGACLMASLASSTNAFNRLEDLIQDSVGLSAPFMNVLNAVGLVGTNFNYPSGALNDRVGPMITGLIGAVVTAGGFFLMSIATTPALKFVLMAGFFLSGVGGGMLWIGAIYVAVNVTSTGGGWPVSCVGSAMALSVAFAIAIVNGSAKIFDCTAPHCWPLYCRALAFAVIVVQTIGALLLLFYKESLYVFEMEDYDDDEDDIPVETVTKRSGKAVDDDNEEIALISAPPPLKREKSLVEIVAPSQVETVITIWQAPYVFTHPYYLLLFFTSWICFTGGLVVLTQASQIWGGFTNTDPTIVLTEDPLGKWILSVFSYLNVAVSLIGGTGANWLLKANICRPATVEAIVNFVCGALSIVLGVMINMPATPANRIVVFLLLESLCVSWAIALVLNPSIVGSNFGFVNFGKFFGLLNLACAISSFATPVVAGAMARAIGSYNVVFYIVGGLLAADGLLLLWVKNRWPLKFPEVPLIVSDKEVSTNST